MAKIEYPSNATELVNYNLNVIEHDPYDIKGALVKAGLSLSEIRRKQKEGAFKLCWDSPDALYFLFGKKLIYITKEWNFLAYQAQAWWSFHNDLVRKTYEWHKVNKKDLEDLQGGDENGRRSNIRNK